MENLPNMHFSLGKYKFREVLFHDRCPNMAFNTVKSLFTKTVTWLPAITIANKGVSLTNPPDTLR